MFSLVCLLRAVQTIHIHYRSTTMLKLAIIFFIISLIAGFFGFTNIAAGAKGIAKILFYVALVIFLVVLVFGVLLGVMVF